MVSHRVADTCGVAWCLHDIQPLHGDRGRTALIAPVWISRVGRRRIELLHAVIPQNSHHLKLVTVLWDDRVKKFDSPATHATNPYRSDQRSTTQEIATVDQYSVGEHTGEDQGANLECR
jgi:hypothetical protein